MKTGPDRQLRLPHRAFLCMLFMGFFSTALLGQEFTGHVTDSSGAAVPGATVTVHNQLSGVETSTKTTDSGDYTVPYLKVGLYSVSVQTTGFQRQTETDITLDADRTLTVNFTLKVGSTSETVTVKADEAFLDEAKADIGETIENDRVTELPLDGRDPLMLAALSPGIINNCTNCPSTPDAQTSTFLSSNGGQNQAMTDMGSNLLLLDGQDNGSGAGSGWQAAITPLDAVQQVKVITNPYDAQYGRAMGAVIDEDIKSGTNRLHGDVYEFARRTWLDANSWQNNYQSLPRPEHKEDQYGAELDGPVFFPHLYNGKNKAFFLLDYEELKETLPATQVASVPDPNWAKTGDFRDLTYFDGNEQSPVTIYDPLTTTCDVNGNCTRQPFPNNQIPPGRLNPVAQKVLSLYPAPNTPTPPGEDAFTSNYAAQIPNKNTYRSVVGKFDFNISNADRLSLRYSYFDNFINSSFSGMPAPIGEGQLPQVDTSNTVAVSWVHTFRSTLLLNVMASGNRHHQWANNSYHYDQSQLGLPTSFLAQEGVDAGLFPQFYTGNAYTGTNGGAGDSYAQEGGNGNGAAYFYNYNFNPSVTWVKGKHTVHAGANYTFLEYGVHTGGEWFGGSNLTFSTGTGFTQFNPANWTPANGGSAVASLLLGSADSGNITQATNTFYTWPYFAPWVQDDWKVTPKLTLNLGLRYDLLWAPLSRNNDGIYAFNSTSINPINAQAQANAASLGIAIQPIEGGVTFLGVGGNPRRFNSLRKANFQPRFGVAYALDSKTVFRGGVGLMFSGNNITNEGMQLFQTGFNATSIYAGNQYNDEYPTSSTISGNDPTSGLYTLSNPFPNGLLQISKSKNGLLTAMGQGETYFDPNLKVPDYWSYSIGVERQFFNHDTVQVSYVGTQSHNEFDPGHGTNQNLESRGYLDNCNVELGGNPNICANDYSNPSPFYGISAFEGSGYDTDPTIWGGDLTRPFPAFGDLHEIQNMGRTWYNALQATALHQMSRALTLHGTWTWSKTMDAGWWHDQLHGVTARWLDLADRPQRITVSAVYLLPVGRGRTLLGNSNRIVDGVIGGWEIAPLYIFEVGTPWGVPGTSAFPGGVGGGGANVAILHNPKINRSIDPATGFIRGVAPCTEEWVAPDTPSSPGFAGNPSSNWAVEPISTSAYSYSGSCAQADFKAAPSQDYVIEPNIVFTGVRLPNSHQFDANFSKNFSIFENLKLQVRLEAFNVLNHPLWQDGYDGGVTDPTFGEIARGQVGQSNLPRQLQLAAKINW